MPTHLQWGGHKNSKNPHFKVTQPPRAMTQGKKIWVKMKHKYLFNKYETK
jgi:hypothetical protein